LLQAGLVEIIRPSGMPVAMNGKIIPQLNRKDQKSLVNRLIERIRSM
jgi:DNA-binding transcriptional regulator YhcF (GntR family)